MSLSTTLLFCVLKGGKLTAFLFFSQLPFSLLVCLAAGSFRIGRPFSFGLDRDLLLLEFLCLAALAFRLL